METIFETRGVLAACYPGGRRAKLENINCLTHSVEVDADGRELRVLCRRVKLDSMVDAGAQDVTLPPTCPVCLVRLAKLAAKAGKP